MRIRNVAISASDSSKNILFPILLLTSSKYHQRNISATAMNKPAAIWGFVVIIVIYFIGLTRRMSCRVFLRSARSDLLGARFGAPSFQSRIVSAALFGSGFAIRRVGRSRAPYSFPFPVTNLSSFGGSSNDK